MRIILVDSTGKNTKEIGYTSHYPIPRVGEQVNCGYNPAPFVKSVVYDYEKEIVFVQINGFIFP